MPHRNGYSRNPSVLQDAHSLSKQPLSVPSPADIPDEGSSIMPSVPLLALWRFLLIAGILVFALLSGIVINWYIKYPAFKEQESTLPSADAFAPNTYVENIALANMTYNEAKKQIDMSEISSLNEVLSIRIGQYLWEIPVSRFYDQEKSISEALDRAFAVGRSITPGILSGGISPFEYRLMSLQSARNQGAYYYASRSWRNENIRAAAQQIADAVFVSPRDADLDTFDFNTKTFTFTHDRTGAMISPDEVEKALSAALDSLSGDTPVISLQLEPQTILPRIRTVDLINSFGLTGSQIRVLDENSRLICSALNGVIIPAGGEMSLFTLVLQQLPQSVSAAGIKANLYSDAMSDVGDMLLHLSARSEMDIIGHSVDSAGAVSIRWPDRDLVFLNLGTYPLFITVDFIGSTAVMSLYGRLSAE